MKNREFYKDKIMNWGESDGSICTNFILPIVFNTDDSVCADMSCCECKIKQVIWLEEEYKEPEVDWTQVKVDTPILVRGYEGEDNEEWQKRYFAKFENGVVYTWYAGTTSWTAKGACWWKEAKLAEVNK